MKKFAFVLMSMVALCPLYADTVVTVDGLMYSLSGAYASVYRIAAGNASEVINVPATIAYDGLQYIVNGVLDRAFFSYYENNNYVKEVYLPNTIESVGDLAFNNTKIVKVKLLEGVKEIGNHAFSSSSITEMVIPSTLNRMGKSCSFDTCDKLRTLIYTGLKSPSNWTATSTTYVPNKEKYGKPHYSINNASVIEMITFSQSNFSYTGVAPTPTWTNNVEGYSVNFSMPALKKEVGSYEEVIPATFTKGEESFTAYIPYSYTIEPAKIKAKVNNVSRTYGEANPNFSITYSGFVNGENESAFTTKPTVTTTATATSDAGTYPLAIGGGEAKNYVFEYEEGLLTVNKASLSIQVMDASKVYGTENPAFTLSYSGLKNGETQPVWLNAPKFNTAATKTSDAGTYPITVECTPKNYTISNNQQGTLTITQAPLSIKANDASMLYCASMPDYSYTYTGFVNNDDASVLTTKPSIATEATEKSNVGTYSITPTGAVAKNYSMSYVAGTLTIKPRELTVTGNSATRLYGEVNPAFTVKYDGFVNGENKSALDVEPMASTKATIQSNAGTYDITVGGGVAKNYTFIYQTGQLTITPRNLKASVGNYEREYGMNNPVFVIVYEGFVGNDTENSLNTKPMVRTLATKTSNVGVYDLEVTGGYSPNYTFTYGAGKLTITMAEQNFSWEQDLSNLEVGSQIELQAKASSGLPVTYSMDATNYAEIYKAGSKTYMECKSAGTFNIKAVQEGNDNYYSTQRINKKVTIVGEGEYNPTFIIKQADNGSVSTKVTKGSSLTFTIHIENGWKILSVFFNGEDVTNQLDADNAFTTPAINESSTLSIVYEQKTTAVSAPISSQIKVVPTPSGISVLYTKTGDLIQVYSTDGILQESTRAEGERTDIPLAKDKVYIVKVGVTALKLSI